MPAVLRCHFLVLIALLCAAPSLAQETTGRLEGQVLDAKGQPIPDVNVRVTSSSLQGGRGCLTSARGTFALLALPVGEYTVRLSHLAYQTQVFEDVQVRLGQTTVLGDVRLQDRVVNQPEMVVSGERPLIDPASTEMGGVLTARQYDALPIQRDYRSAVSLLPQISESPYGDPVNFAGSTGGENHYFIDGMDVTEPYRNASGAQLPYNFIREVRARTGGYEAEYRGALGGSIDAVTYSGSNTPTGSAFVFYTNSNMAAKARKGPGAPQTGDTETYDVGLSVGGPLRKDRLWYYLAYNPNFAREKVEIPGQGMFTDKGVTHSFAGKLTWKLNERNNLTAALTGDPSNRDAVAAPYTVYLQPVTFLNADPYLMTLGGGTVSAIVEDRHFVRDNLLIQGALSASWFRDRNLPRTARGDAEMLFIDSQTGTWSGGAQDRVDNRSQATTGRASFSWQSGDHEIKGGLEYRDARASFDQRSAFVQEYSDSSYFHFAAEVGSTVGSRTPSVYLQDSWQIRPRLRVNAGLRWDGLYIVASNDKVAQKILDQWQPRLGFVWQPTGSGTQRVFASLARYYQDLALYPLLFYYDTNRRWDFMYYDHDPRVDPSGGDTLSLPGSMQPEVRGLKGQYFDEVTLGYEQRVGPAGRMGARGVFRTLGQALEDGITPAGAWVFGNPGSGAMAAYPRARREYVGLELSYRQVFGGRTTMMVSYVVSRNYGNHPGLFNPDLGGNVPNGNGSFDVPELLTNGTGLLPNDRTHVFKLFGHHRVNRSLTVGAVGSVESGTPLNEYGGAFIGAPYIDFMRQRGTAGRTPTIWDLNLRVSYELAFREASGPHARIIVDLLHVASQHKPVRFDQIHYFDIDAAGNEINPNPTYGLPTSFQPPMAVRIGAETRF